MKAIIIDILIALALGSAWLGALGFARLNSSLDRLHCVTFVYVGCGLPLAIAAFVSDGLSSRALKMFVLVIVALVAGASLNQTAARAIFDRDEAGERM